ncbi:MAG: hypothetical protein OXG49_18615 [Chloroflexi bacterium]|nr:hypothetical protein [Chloroflexota bacterium]
MRSLPFVSLNIALALALTACGTMAPAPVSSSEAPKAGLWSLRFSGDCSEQEAESLLITQLDEEAIVFDEFELLRNEAGAYVGSAIFTAPMPVDGRDIPYEIRYALASDDGGFSGTETIIEGGGHGLACPIELAFVSGQ